MIPVWSESINVSSKFWKEEEKVEEEEEEEEEEEGEEEKQLLHRPKNEYSTFSILVVT